MNRKIILNVLKKLVPKGTRTLAINLVDGDVTIVDADGKTSSDKLKVDDVKAHVDMMKDYLNIKGNINRVDVDFTKKTVEFVHTNGTAKL